MLVWLYLMSKQETCKPPGRPTLFFEIDHKYKVNSEIYCLELVCMCYEQSIKLPTGASHANIVAVDYTRHDL